MLSAFAKARPHVQAHSHIPRNFLLSYVATQPFRDVQVWLKQPLVSVKEISVRHDIVEAFVSDPELRERLRDQHLRGRQHYLSLKVLNPADCRLPSVTEGGLCLEGPSCTLNPCPQFLSELYLPLVLS